MIFFLLSFFPLFAFLLRVVVCYTDIITFFFSLYRCFVTDRQTDGIDGV